jgi:hypothetical protein
MSAQTILMVFTLCGQILAAGTFHWRFTRGVDQDLHSQEYRSYFYDSALWGLIFYSACVVGKAAVGSIVCWLSLLLEFALSPCAILPVVSIAFLDWRLLSKPTASRTRLTRWLRGLVKDLDKSPSKQIYMGNAVYIILLSLTVGTSIIALGPKLARDGFSSLDEECSFSGDKWFLGVMLCYYFLLFLVVVVWLQLSIHLSGGFLLKESFLIMLYTLALQTYRIALALDADYPGERGIVPTKTLPVEGNWEDLIDMWGSSGTLIMEVICCLGSHCLGWGYVNALTSNTTIKPRIVNLTEDRGREYFNDSDAYDEYLETTGTVRRVSELPQRIRSRLEGVPDEIPLRPLRREEED